MRELKASFSAQLLMRTRLSAVADGCDTTHKTTGLLDKCPVLGFHAQVPVVYARIVCRIED